jgi:TRAP-type C4-dicarboxylate transport system permease small subunit
VIGVLRLVDRLAIAMAYVSGAMLLLASFYITADVIGRRFFHLSSGVTDEFGGYALAVGGMWALAFALTTGGHVRIDVLLPYLPPVVRSVLDYAALVAMTLFGSVIAYYTWQLTIESFATDARATSFLRTPLFVPQAVLATGFTLLAVQAVVMVVAAAVESVRAGSLAPIPLLRLPDVTDEI